MNSMGPKRCRISLVWQAGDDGDGDDGDGDGGEKRIWMAKIC